MDAWGLILLAGVSVIWVALLSAVVYLVQAAQAHSS